MIHPRPVDTSCRLLTVHGHGVPVFAWSEAKGGQTSQWSSYRWTHTSVEAAQCVEAIHGHGQGVNGLLIQQLLWPPAARLEAEDEDDHGHDDADDDGGGCGNDDVVQFLGAADPLGPDLPALLKWDS